MQISRSAVLPKGVIALFLVLPQVLAQAARADWQSMASRWAVARDPDGHAVEIDDLTYPGFLGRAVIGRIPPVKKPAQVLEAENRSAGGSSRVNAEDWWSAVPWKAPLKSMGAPRSFAFNDIDFSRATRDPRRFKAISEQWDQRIQPDFLSHFRFVRSPDGGYEVRWDPKELPPGGPPLQVVTLRSTKANLWRAVGRQTLELALTEATSLITVPVLSALFGTALDRFFHWSDLLISTRQDALAEALEDPALDLGLSAYERERAAESLLYAETSLLVSPSWLWLKPRKQWASRMIAEKRASTASRAWLTKAGVDVEPLGVAFDGQAASGRFYLSGAGLPWGHTADGPTLGLDATRPNGIFERRLAVEISTTAVIFSSTWIPVVGGIEAQAFKALVEVPEDRLRRWEARLGLRLEERERIYGENWEAELEHLAFQQENPFEISRAQSRVVVASRKAALGLPGPSPTVEPALSVAVDDRVEVYENPNQE